MSFNRKTCSYKNCKRDPGSTLFKFPDDAERFAVWCVNAGLNVKGEFDITEPRYLCEKHFSGNYICNQSRRKMLVYTAIPSKYNESIDEEPKFTVVGNPPKRGKRFRHSSYSEQSNPVEAKTTILNIRRSTRPTTTSRAQESDVEEQPVDEHSTETISIQSLDINEAHNEANTTYEEIVVPNTRKYKLVVLKPKRKAEVEPSYEEVSPQKSLKYEDEEVYPIEDADISSSNLEPVEAKREERVQETSEALESYSEFIFNGEKYVQMPQRVFEAEKEKIRKEGEKYKLLLRKLKAHLSKLDLE